MKDFKPTIKSQKMTFGVLYIEYIFPQMKFIQDSIAENEKVTYRSDDFINNVHLCPNQVCMVLKVTGELCQVRSAQNVFGYKEKVFPSLFFGNGKLIHPEDRKEFFFLSRMAIENEINHPAQPLENEYKFMHRLKKASGEYTKVITSLSTLTQSRKGYPTSLFILTSDLTSPESCIRPQYPVKTHHLNIFQEKKPSTFSRIIKLSEREKDVLTLIRYGFSSKMIGDKLNISKNTVDVHRKKLLKKTGSGNTAQLVSRSMFDYTISSHNFIAKSEH